jgi:hypothetical protein
VNANYNPMSFLFATTITRYPMQAMSLHLCGLIDYTRINDMFKVNGTVSSHIVCKNAAT